MSSWSIPFIVHFKRFWIFNSEPAASAASLVEGPDPPRPASLAGREVGGQAVKQQASPAVKQQAPLAGWEVGGHYWPELQAVKDKLGKEKKWEWVSQAFEREIKKGGGRKSESEAFKKWEVNGSRVKVIKRIKRWPQQHCRMTGKKWRWTWTIRP